jgi:hypothetical protein
VHPTPLVPGGQNRRKGADFLLSLAQMLNTIRRIEPGEAQSGNTCRLAQPAIPAMKGQALEKSICTFFHKWLCRRLLS